MENNLYELVKEGDRPYFGRNPKPEQAKTQSLVDRIHVILPFKLLDMMPLPKDERKGPHGSKVFYRSPRFWPGQLIMNTGTLDCDELNALPDIGFYNFNPQIHDKEEHPAIFRETKGFTEDQMHHPTFMCSEPKPADGVTDPWHWRSSGISDKCDIKFQHDKERFLQKVDLFLEHWLTLYNFTSFRPQSTAPARSLINTAYVWSAPKQTGLNQAPEYQLMTRTWTSIAVQKSNNKTYGDSEYHVHILFGLPSARRKQFYKPLTSPTRSFEGRFATIGASVLENYLDREVAHSLITVKLVEYTFNIGYLSLYIRKSDYCFWGIKAGHMLSVDTKVIILDYLQKLWTEDQNYNPRTTAAILTKVYPPDDPVVLQIQQDSVPNSKKTITQKQKEYSIAVKELRGKINQKVVETQNCSFTAFRKVLENMAQSNKLFSTEILNHVLDEEKQFRTTQAFVRKVLLKRNTFIDYWDMLLKLIAEQGKTMELIKLLNKFDKELVKPFQATLGYEVMRNWLIEHCKYQENDTRKKGFYLQGPSGSGKSFIRSVLLHQLVWGTYETDCFGVGSQGKSSIKMDADHFIVSVEEVKNDQSLNFGQIWQYYNTRQFDVKYEVNKTSVVHRAWILAGISDFETLVAKSIQRNANTAQDEDSSKIEIIDRHTVCQIKDFIPDGMEAFTEFITRYKKFESSDAVQQSREILSLFQTFMAFTLLNDVAKEMRTVPKKDDFELYSKVLMSQPSYCARIDIAASACFRNKMRFLPLGEEEWGTYPITAVENIEYQMIPNKPEVGEEPLQQLFELNGSSNGFQQMTDTPLALNSNLMTDEDEDESQMIGAKRRYPY